MSKIKLPSVLAFERKLETSDGLMYSGNWNEQEASKWADISISKRQNRSTQSAYGIPDEKKDKPNPVSSDSDDANLAMDHDTLKLDYTIRVIGNLGNPFSCNDQAFESSVIKESNNFKESEDISILGQRYAYNIANGRFLWRNRVGAENIKICVTVPKENLTLEFDPYEFSLQDFETNKNDASLDKLARVFTNGLKGDENTFTLIEVSAYVKLGKGQHVFPSQEMNMGEKSKKLFQLEGCAAMHNVKIGNALRTIDTWHTEGDETPIAAEPFGAVTQRGIAYRKTKNDFYTILGKMVNDSSQLTSEEKCYAVANIIRGGVFGAKSD